MRITLNLATRPFADLGPAVKRLRIAMAVLAVLAIGLGFGLRAIDKKAEAARAKERSLDRQIAGITHERDSYYALMQQPPNALLVRQADALNKLFDEKGFSWTLAMEDLETVLPAGVQVSTLEPIREKDGRITLHLRVIGPRDRAVDLVRNLEHSKRFLMPRIVGENSETAANGLGQHLEPVSASNRVNFDLLAEYNPATAGEHRAQRKASPASHAAMEHRAMPPATQPMSQPLQRPGQPMARPPYMGSPATRPISPRVPTTGGPQ